MGPVLRFHGDQIHGHRVTGEQPQVTGWTAIAQQHQAPWSGELARAVGLQHICCGGLPDRLRRGHQR